MSDDDRARWDGRYTGALTGAPGPPEALAGRTALLPRTGRALDVACGRGTVALWLALRGLRVDAVDVSGAAMAALASAATHHRVAGRVHPVVHDLDAGLPPSCPGPYQVVVCQRFRDPARYPELVDRLAPGGLLVITVLSEVGGSPGPFRAPCGELARAFADLEVLADSEADGLAHLVGSRR